MHRSLYIFFLIFIFSKELISDSWTDNSTSLIWELKNQNNIVSEYTWADANNYCDNLNLDGFNNWWLPSTSQLKTISNMELFGEFSDDWEDWFLENEDYKNGGFFIKEILQYNLGTEGDYWAFSDYAHSAKSEEEEAWFVDFEAGYDDWTYISSQHYVRCVRSP